MSGRPLPTPSHLTLEPQARSQTGGRLSIRGDVATAPNSLDRALFSILVSRPVHEEDHARVDWADARGL